MAWDIQQMAQDLSQSPAALSNPGVSTASIAPPQVTANADLPKVLGQPQDINWAQEIGHAMATGGSGLTDNPMYTQIAERQRERARLQHASDQTQAMTGMLANALSSGDPSQLASVIKQLSGIKGLEPETMEALQKQQINLGQHIADQAAQSAQNEAIATALTSGGGLQTQEGQFINSVLKANPGMKPTDAVKFLDSATKMGLFEKSKEMTVRGVGLVRIPGTMERGRGEQPSIIMPEGASSKEQPSWDENIQKAGLAEFSATGKIANPRTLHALGLDPKDPLSSQRAAEQIVGRTRIEATQKLAEYGQQRQTALDIAKAGKINDPAPGRWIDKTTGIQANPTNSDVEADHNGAKALQSISADQEKELAAVNTLYTHVEQTIKQASALPLKGNELGVLLNTKMSKLKNNPDAKVLYDALGPMTALAIGRALQGSGGRGGVRMAEFLAKTVTSENDTLKTSIAKWRNALEIGNSNARTANLPIVRGESILKQIDRLSSGKYGQPTMVQALPGGFR